MPPILPMLAKSVPAVPDSADYSFEPKWDWTFLAVSCRAHA